MRYAFYWIFLCLLTSSVALAEDFKGRVVSETGGPLAGVKVLDMPNQEVVTNVYGRFVFPSVPRGTLKVVDKERSIRFTLPGYQPLTSVLTLDKESEIVLRRDSEPRWTPKRCTADATLHGDVLAFALPANTEVDRYQDVDYSAITVRSGDSMMMLAWGEFWSLGIPGPAFFAGVSQLRERSLEIGENVTVAEYRGTRTDGNFRYIGLYGETISYENAGKEAAEYFDRIIDSLCWARVPAQRILPR